MVFQQYFSYIKATARIIHVFPGFDWLTEWCFNSISVISRRQLALFMSFLGFTSTRLGLWSVLPKDTPTKKPRGSSAAWTQDPWIYRTISSGFFSNFICQSYRSSVKTIAIQLVAYSYLILTLYQTTKAPPWWLSGELVGTHDLVVVSSWPGWSKLSSQTLYHWTTQDPWGSEVSCPRILPRKAQCSSIFECPWARHFRA